MRKICPLCKNNFETDNENKTYCSRKCSVKFRKRLKESKTVKVYKKVRLMKDGNCYPLFIDKKKPFTFGEWMKAEFHPTKGFAPRSINGIDNANPIGGWHGCFKPLAPHIADNTKSGEQRVWIECEAKGNMQTYNRPESQGGSWILVEYIKPIRVLTEEEIKTLVA